MQRMFEHKHSLLPWNQASIEIHSDFATADKHISETCFWHHCSWLFFCSKVHLCFSSLTKFVVLSHIGSALKYIFPTYFSHNCSATCSVSALPYSFSYFATVQCFPIYLAMLLFSLSFSVNWWQNEDILAMLTMTMMAPALRAFSRQRKERW